MEGPKHPNPDGDADGGEVSQVRLKRTASAYEGETAVAAAMVDAEEALTTLRRAHNTFAEQRRKMDEERRALEEEKERMTQRSMTDGDMVRLNVGGQYMTTTRATLCQAKASYLEALFSGRWEDRATKDETGAYFFDLDPDCITILVRYLRQRRVTPPDQAVPVPEIKKELVGAWQACIEYLGLTDFLNDGMLYLDLLPGNCLMRTGDGYYTPYLQPCHHDYDATGTGICTTPITKTTAWRFRLGISEGGGDIHFGVVRDIKAEVFSGGETSCYGWAPNRSARNLTPPLVPTSDIHDGDEVLLRVNFENSQLELHNQRSGQLDFLELPAEQTRWYFMLHISAEHTFFQMLPLCGA